MGLSLMANLNTTGIIYTAIGLIVFAILSGFSILTLPITIFVVPFTILPIAILVSTYQGLKILLNKLKSSHQQAQYLSAKIKQIQTNAMQMFQQLKRTNMMHLVQTKITYFISIVSINCKKIFNFVLGTSFYKFCKRTFGLLINKASKAKKSKRYQNEIKFQEWRARQCKKSQTETSQVQKLQQQIASQNTEIYQLRKQCQQNIKQLQTSIQEQKILQRENLALREQVLQKCRLIEDLRIQKNQGKQMIRRKQNSQANNEQQSMILAKQTNKIQQIIQQSTEQNRNLKRKIEQYSVETAQSDAPRHESAVKAKVGQQQEINPQGTQASIHKQEETQVDIEQQQNTEDNCEQVSQQKNKTDGNLTRAQKKRARKMAAKTKNEQMKDDMTVNQ